MEQNKNIYLPFMDREIALSPRPHRLANEPGRLGLSCTRNGVALAGVPLLSGTPSNWTPRPREDIEALLQTAYGERCRWAGVAYQLEGIARTLNRGELGAAMIATLHLRLPDLSWKRAERLAKAYDALAKYDPGEPRDRMGRWTTVQPPTGDAPLGRPRSGGLCGPGQGYVAEGTA